MPRLLGWLCMLLLAAALSSIQTVSADASSFSSAMQAAAQARHVPLPLIEAIAYVNTRWEWISTPAIDGGVGPMKLTPSQMTLATSLSGHSQAEITGDLAANLDAGAALLANAHASGTDLASWQPAAAATQGPQVAKEVFAVLRSGAGRTTSTGEAITLAPQPVAAPTGSAPSVSGPAAAAAACTTDYPPAACVPADPSNFSWGNRTHDYPINLIVIHDIEGDSSTAIQLFQSPNFGGSAHYVTGYDGSITQMVHEKDIAWHAGNWDYNTRAIGIEHAGFAAQNLYTTAEYNASAALAASICSRYGVPLDRTHVIGHNEVPDPNNPGQFGGVDHHTDPGPYWNWSYYMTQAVNAAASLSSAPHMGPDPVAVNGLNSAAVTWVAAQACRKPITGYTVTQQPGNITQSLPASATSATFNNLQPGTSYTFAVTATNPDGQDSLTSNVVVPGHCATAQLTASPASPTAYGTSVKFTGSSTGCPNPLYQFWTQAPGSTAWQLGQDYSSSAIFTWSTTAQVFGAYHFLVRARDSASAGNFTDGMGAYDTSTNIAYTVTTATCGSVTATAAPGSSAPSGTQVTVTAIRSGCPNPVYEFWYLGQGSSAWQLVQSYSTSNTYKWNSTGALPGSHVFSVWVHDASTAGANATSLGSYDAYGNTTYTIAAPSCASVTAAATPASPQPATTPVTITATPGTCSNPNSLYEFWYLGQGSSTWQLVQGYSTKTTYSWNSTGALAGSHIFSVWIRDAASPGLRGALGSTYDAYGNNTFTITTGSCGSVTASATPASPQASGTHVTITATAVGCTNPRYEFWILAPGGSWTPAQPYSSSNTFNWTTTGLPAGTYYYSVWVRDASSSAAYDAYFPGTAYALT